MAHLDLYMIRLGRSFWLHMKNGGLLVPVLSEKLTLDQLLTRWKTNSFKHWASVSVRLRSLKKNRNKKPHVTYLPFLSKEMSHV